MTELPRARSLRTRLMLVVAAGATIVLVLLTAAFNVVLGARFRHDADDLLRQRASAHLSTLQIGSGTLRAPEAPDAGAVDSPIWVFAGLRALERPAAPAADQRGAAVLAGGPRRYLEIPSFDVRLYAVPVVASGRRLGTIVAAVSLAPYERTAHTALVASIAFAALVLVAILLAARWAIGAALRPVAAMTAEAAQRSEHDIEGGFAIGEPHDEITGLAATFDAMLARLAASLRRERSFSAEVSHELRTPLAKLAAEADLALRRERAPVEYRRALVAIRRGAAEMARTLDTLVAAARAEAGGARAVSDARDGVTAAVRACTADAEARGVRVEIDAPAAPVRVGAEAEVVERVLVPLLENGCRYAAHEVRVRVAPAGGHARLTVVDDGPGVDEALGERIFDPGIRGDHEANGHDGAGLGLALSRRLARAVDGDVELDASGAGAAFSVRLPAVSARSR